MSDTESRCGHIAIIGRPNVGKSTLLNALVGQKISITSRKPQTTRHQIAGVRTEGPVQLVFMDTPGLHESEKQRMMNRYMNRLADSVVAGADVILFLVDAVHWRVEDDLILKKIGASGVPIILVLNKLDNLPDKKDVLPVMASLKDKFPFAHIVPLSARRGENLATLEQLLAEMMPKGPHLFPEDQVTDRNERFRIAELIREKIIHGTNKELPYATTVVVESIRPEGKLLDISAVIWVEREGQKPIVIGKDGERLKKIGTLARKDIEKMLGRKVFLRLWVRVQDGWTEDERALGSLGYE